MDGSSATGEKERLEGGREGGEGGNEEEIFLGRPWIAVGLK
jgi:hypothetical protein